jgi:hypothetical protein
MIKFKKYSQLNEAKKPIPGDAINIFDIDDTLIYTAAKIRVYDPSSGKEYSMSPAEYNEYEQQPHHELDFTDFDDIEMLKNGQLIDWVVNILKKTMSKGKAVGIITARSAGKKALGDFFKHLGIKIHPDLIFSVNDPSEHYTGNNAERKQMAFEELIDMGYNTFRFFDDDLKNLQYAKELEKKHNIKMTLHHIQPKWHSKMTEAYNGRILEKNESREEITRWWALFAHISNLYATAEDSKQLMQKFMDARKISIKEPTVWPLDAIKYFYDWHLQRIRDKNRVKKAQLMQTESLHYYNENLKP